MKTHLLLLLAFAAPITAAQADVLELRSGQVLNGRYLGGSQSTIRFQTEEDLQVIPVVDILALTFTGSPPQAASMPAPAPAAPTTRPPGASQASTRPVAAVTVPAGTPLYVRMADTITSKDAAGKRFTTHLEADLSVNGILVAPAGSKVYGFIEYAREAGRLAGKSKLELSLTDISIENKIVPIVTTQYYEQGKDSTGKTLATVGIGAAIGGAIDGGEGAAKGAAIGTGVAAITKGETLDVPAGALLQFRLTAPLQATVSPPYSG